MRSDFWNCVKQGWKKMAGWDTCLIELFIANCVLCFSWFAVKTGQLPWGMVYGAFCVWVSVWLARYLGSPRRIAYRRRVLFLCACFTAFTLFATLLFCARQPETLVMTLGRPGRWVFGLWLLINLSLLYSWLFRGFGRKPGRDDGANDSGE